MDEALVAAFAGLDDELCTWPPTPGLYTRGNGADQWPRPITPLTQDVVGRPQWDALGHTMSDRIALARPPLPTEAWVGCFYGYVTVGFTPVMGIAEAMPGWSAQSVAQQYFGLPPDPGFVAPAAARTKPLRLAGVAVRLLREGRCYPKRARRYQEIARERLARARVRDWTAVTDENLASVFEQAMNEGGPWRVPLLEANMFAASGYERLVKQAERHADDEHGALVAAAVRGVGDFQMSAAMDAITSVASGGLRLDDVIERFGFRGPMEYELAADTWSDNPAYLAQLVEQARNRAGVDVPRPEDRAQARAQLRRRMGRLRWARFSASLRSYEKHVGWRENAKVHEVMGVAVVRMAAREAGRRLAGAGRLDHADDVFFLRIGELLAELAQGAGPDHRVAVARRRANHDRAAALDFPELCRAGPDGLHAVGDDEIRALGLVPPAPAAATDGVLTGIGASPGRVTAPARVVTDPFTDALVDGEVLVARTTDPAWTPLFLQAAAVVIDLGGQLSHGAVISRDLGIPCVMNVKEGTARIKTGQPVTVDGERGEVVLA
jgi:phosphohistidine swiveling domain-containing protein